MSRELEEQLAAVPERWRDDTRTRAYAVMDFIAAGVDGSLLVPVLCRRTGLTTSAFYTLVRRWKASGEQVGSLVPWARQPGSKPRVAAEATAHIDSVVTPLLMENPRRPTEPIAQSLLANWPASLPRAGISYLRKRVNHLRAEQEKKTRRARRHADGEAEPGDAPPRPRWPFDVIVIDHVAIEAVVWLDGEPTLPIATLAIDLARRRAVGMSIGLDEPSPGSVVAALLEPASAAAARGAPGPPTIVLSTTFAKGWPELVSELTMSGATVVTRRSKKLSFGLDAVNMLGGHLGRFKLAARLGHRPIDERAGPRAVATMPSLELNEVYLQLLDTVRKDADAILVEESWPPAAVSDASVWNGVADLIRDGRFTRW